MSDNQFPQFPHTNRDEMLAMVMIAERAQQPMFHMTGTVDKTVMSRRLEDLR